MARSDASPLGAAPPSRCLSSRFRQRLRLSCWLPLISWTSSPRACSLHAACNERPVSGHCTRPKLGVNYNATGSGIPAGAECRRCLPCLKITEPTAPASCGPAPAAWRATVTPPMAMRPVLSSTARGVGRGLSRSKLRGMPAPRFGDAGAAPDERHPLTGMRHPLTGGGMTVALHDTKLLCDMLSGPLDLADPVLTAKQTYAYYTRRKPWAATINTLANALYKVRRMRTPVAICRSHTHHRPQVFCDTGESWSEEMRQACFDYLRLGGIYAQGPISLLSGLNPRPFILVAHFFMVALYGVRPGSFAPSRSSELTRLHRLAGCSSLCPRRARSLWACACCWAPAPSFCPSSVRRACARCSFQRLCVLSRE